MNVNVIDSNKQYIIKNIKRLTFLYGNTFQIHHPNKSQFTEEFYKEQMIKKAEYIEKGMGKVFIAIDASDIFGFLHVYTKEFLDEKRLVISEFIVDADYRNQGIGTKLMKTAIMYANEINCDGIETLSVNTKSTKSFYHENGFQEYRIEMIKHLN